MICCAFIFTPGEYDDEFRQLDSAIDTYARSLAGFIKSESWFSSDQKSKNAMYYFQDRASLEKLANLPAHLKAKEKVDNWYDDYRIEIFELIDQYDKRNPKFSR